MGAPAAAGGSFIGLWQEEDSAFLFFSSPAEDVVRSILKDQPHLRLVDRTSMPYEQWQGMPAGGGRIGRFQVIPAWEPPAAAAGAGGAAVPLILDPGLVFGAGSHPTTRDCLSALELAAGEGDLGTLLDLGTGSGILAVAAALLGGRRILAVDLNRLACLTAVRNVRLNRLGDRVLVVQGRAEEHIACPADLLAANIHGEVMLKIVDSPEFRRKRRFILSGLMRSDAKEVRRRLSLQGIHVAEQWVREGIWHTYYAVGRRAA
jgi:ribosomal protein L11 methyltransferase